jgi:hypothetical protein
LAPEYWRVTAPLIGSFPGGDPEAGASKVSFIFAAERRNDGAGRPFFTSLFFYRAFTQVLNRFLRRGVPV